MLRLGLGRHPSASITNEDRSRLFPNTTLFNWRQELELDVLEMQKARTDGSLSLVAKLQKLAETLCALALMKAQSASVGEIRHLFYSRKL